MSSKHRTSGLQKLPVEVSQRHGTQVRRSGDSMEDAKPSGFNSSALKQASDHALKETFAIRRALSSGRFTSRPPSIYRKSPSVRAKAQLRLVKENRAQPKRPAKGEGGKALS